MLSGLKVLVTGASSGIGRSTCKVMSSHGALVVGIGRNEDNLKAMVEEKHISSYVVADLVGDNECERAGSDTVYANVKHNRCVCCSNLSSSASSSCCGRVPYGRADHSRQQRWSVARWWHGYSDSRQLQVQLRYYDWQHSVLV